MKLKEAIERKAGGLKYVRGYTDGNLDISFRQLTSLEGAPENVHGDFNCSYNKLSSFEHFPKHIDGNCYINNNRFTSFKGVDQYVEYIGGILINYAIMNITSGYSDLFSIDGLQTVRLPDNHKYNLLPINIFLLKT